LYEIGKENPNPVTLVINISDWHIGKLVIGANILGDADYNIKIFENRVEKYLEKIVRFIEKLNPEKVLILNYGDGVDDPTALTYPNQIEHQDLKHEKQLARYLNELEKFILHIYDYQPNIEYKGVKGNHSPNGLNCDRLANILLKDRLANYETIEVNAED
jgi:hypothetical protein